MSRLKEYEDYYLDPKTGNICFTREYLEREGTCCQSRCRHCPYGFNPDSTPTPQWVVDKRPQNPG